jgi:hypothetical protein
VIATIETVGAVGVGSSAVLGCVFLAMALIIDMLCLIALEVVLYKMTSQENQYRRQHYQDRRKNGDDPCEANNAPGMNLGISSKPNVKCGLARSKNPRVLLALMQ